MPKTLISSNRNFQRVLCSPIRLKAGVLWSEILTALITLITFQGSWIVKGSSLESGRAIWKTAHWNSFSLVGIWLDQSDSAEEEEVAVLVKEAGASQVPSLKMNICSTGGKSRGRQRRLPFTFWLALARKVCDRCGWPASVFGRVVCVKRHLRTCQNAGISQKTWHCN